MGHTTSRKKLIWGICLIFTLFVLVSLLLYKGSGQAQKKAVILSRMDSYVGMAERVISSDGNIPNGGISYLDTLSAFIPDDIRITVIDSVGNVSFDSFGSNLGNHSDRPEIVDAIAKGDGVSVRKSETSSLPYIYYAKKLPDGDIVRVAQVFELDLQHFLSTDWPLMAGICAIALAAFLCIYIMIDKAQRHERERSEEEKRRLKHQMTGNISHELKTPVAGIQGYLEILVNHPECPQEKRNEYTKRAFVQSLRLSELIRDISIVTKMEEVPQYFKKEKLFLKAVVDQVIDEMSTAMAEKDIRCMNNILEGFEVTANRELLYAIFRNLIENSVKYAGKGAEIIVEGSASTGVIYKDNGCGIADEDDFEHIFDRFWRGSVARSEVPGSGLGLSIVRNAVHLHGASIKAFKPEEGGLGFVIEGL